MPIYLLVRKSNKSFLGFITPEVSIHRTSIHENSCCGIYELSRQGNTNTTVKEDI